jgi:hypothetical protein
MNLEVVSMAGWLTPLTQVLCEGQATEHAERLRAALQRFDGPVPFRLVHLWRADVVLPLLRDALPEHPQDLLTLQRLHQRAALGLLGRQGEWRMALKPVMQRLYRRAYAYNAAYAQAHESTMTFGLAPANTTMLAEQFGDVEAFAQYYAQLSTEANATAFAQANAGANTEIAARAFARNDANAYAAISGASARVYAWACADSAEQRREVFNRMAEGLNHCVATLQINPTDCADGEQHE